MQFITNGPEIPTELLHAQERGEVVFVCGAGISRTVNLPSFYELTKNIYEALHENWEQYPAEAEGMNKAHLTLDRTLFALQMRLASHDPRQAAEVRRQIIAAVQKSLEPPPAHLVHHMNILRLSRDVELRTRVVTTNFDTLFERAWQDSRKTKIRSYAVAEMPAPGSADFEGVLHLHGRIADEKLELVRSDLVLTSAEFGEAYLRSGWAARYVYDLARTSAIVIVGYGVDDPPMRYLMEVLTADRSRFVDLKPIYAFVPSDEDERSRAKQLALWKARGTTPIVYDHKGGADHSALYDTLDAWSNYADHPTNWRSSRAKNVLAADSAPPDAASWGQLEWSLSRGDGDRILADVNPSPSWLPVLRARNIIGPNGFSPKRWLSRRLDDPDMILAVLMHFDIDEDLATHLNWALEEADPLHETRKYWRLCLANRSSRSNEWDGRWFGLLKRIKRGESGLELRRNLADILRPMPAARRAMNWGETFKAEGNELRDKIDIDFQLRDYVEPNALLNAWPTEHDEALVRSLVRALSDALEDAVEYEFVSAELDRASRDVNSVAEHEQDRLRDGFYPLVRMIADLINRMASTNQIAALAISREIGSSQHLLMRRIYLHSLSLADVFTPKQAAEAILKLGHHEFWSSDFRRETMRLMAERWSGLSSDQRNEIESRIIAGVPKSLLNGRDEAEDQIRIIRDREVFIRLARLESRPAGLSDKGIIEIARLREQHPSWYAGEGERDDFASWSISYAGEQGDPKLLESVSNEHLVSEALSLAKRDPFYQGELWRKFIRADPARALDGLIAQAERGEWIADAWSPFFWVLLEADLPDLERKILNHLLNVPLDKLKGFSHSVTDWIFRRFNKMIVDHDVAIVTILVIWDRLFDCIDPNGEEDDADEDGILSAVLNDPLGSLSRLLIIELGRRKPERGSKLPDDLAARFMKISKLKGRAGAIVYTALIGELPYLHAVDPDWAETNLLPMLSESERRAPILWAALVRNRTFGDLRLWRKIKPLFLDSFGNPALSRNTIRGLVNHLIANLVGRQAGDLGEDAPTFMEAKRALLEGGPDARRHAAYCFFDKIRKAGANAEQEWRKTIGPIFVAIWPMQATAQTADTTLYLAWMARESGDAFPEVVDAIRPAIVSSPRAEQSLIDHLNDEQAALYRKYPVAAVRLIDGLVDREKPPSNLAIRLEELVNADPQIERDPQFERLVGIVRRMSS